MRNSLKINALALACVGALTLLAEPVLAGPLCSDMSLARSGRSLTCTVKRIGSTEVGVPKLVWSRLSDSQIQKSLVTGTFLLQGRETELTANRSALALGLDSKSVTAALQTMPSNTPMVVGRYDPNSLQFKVEIMKVEKYVENGVEKAGLFVASFTPEHGDIWASSRYYLSPADRASGTVVGKNPFVGYDKGDSVFHDISFVGAQVAMGHAMRLVGAPNGLFMTTESRIDMRTETSGNLFTKKTTYIYDGKVKPVWFIVQPTEFLRGGEQTTMPAICANNLSDTTCPLYATATAGVNFERFTGGMLDETEETYELKRQSQRGFTFLGQIAISVALGYGAAYLYSAVAPTMQGMFTAAGSTAGSAAVSTGTSAVATGATASTAASAAAAVPLGGMGTLATNMGWVSAMTGAQGLAMEVGFSAASTLALGGATGSTYNMRPENMMGFASVQRGNAVQDTNEFVGLLRGHTAGRMVGSGLASTTSAGSGMAGFNTTINGNCALNSTLASCKTAGAQTGVALRADQYIEQPVAQFIRKNSTSIVRDAYVTDGSIRIN